MSFKDVTSAKRKSRSAYKGKITFIVSDLQKKFTEKTLLQSFFTKQELVINKYIDKINNLNDEIQELADQNKIEFEDKDRQGDINEF